MKRGTRKGNRLRRESNSNTDCKKGMYYKDDKDGPYVSEKSDLSDKSDKADKKGNLIKWLEENSRLNSEEKRIVGLLLGRETEKVDGLRKLTSLKLKIPGKVVSCFLYDESERVRLGALDFLLSLGEISDISRVIELSRDSSEQVREKACRLLGYGGKKSLSALIDALMDGDVRVRRAAACALEKCVHKDMWEIDIKRIVANLEDSDEEVCEYISKSLKSIGKVCVPALNSMVIQGEIPAQRRMLEVLSTFEDLRSREIFRMFVNDADRIVREHAANGLLKIAEDKDVEPLVDVFSNDRGKVSEFVSMLLKLPGKGIEQLKGCLNSTNPNSRMFAILCLSHLGVRDIEIYEKIARKIYDESAEVRIEVIRAIDNLGFLRSKICERNREVLVRGINDNDWRVRAETLRCISNNNLNDNLVVMYRYVEDRLGDERPEVRALAVDTLNVLGIIGNEEIKDAIPKLIEMMLDPTEDYKIVEKVANILSSCKDERLAKPFVELLVRGHFCDLCISGLKKIGKKSKDAILEKMKEIYENRAEVLALLYKFGEKKSKDELFRMMDKDAYEVLKGAIHSDCKRLISEVTECMSDEKIIECINKFDEKKYACFISKACEKGFLLATKNLRYRNPLDAVRILLLCRYTNEKKRILDNELAYHLNKLLLDYPEITKKCANVKDTRKRAKIALTVFS